MTNTKKIEEIVAKETRNGGFMGRYKVSQMNEKPHISGSVDLRDSVMKIGYNPSYQDHDGLELMARDVARHETNHILYRGFKGCPRNVDYHAERFIEPIAEVLLKKGFESHDVHYVANTLEDTILHADLGGKFALDGIAETFSDNGRSAENSHYTQFYDAHVKLNMILWGNKMQKRKVRSYFVHGKEKQMQIAEVLQNFLKRSGLSGMKRDRKSIRDFLNNEGNWQMIARVYAEEFSKLMEPGYALAIFNHSGKGTKGREIDAEEGPLDEGNIFDREMETEAYKMRRVQGAYDSDKSVPPMMDSFEALDLLYQNLARKLKIKVKSFTESEQRPVFWHGQRSFDPERDNLKHVTFGFDENGKVELRKRRHPETINIPHKRFPKGFPETRFGILDTSESMRLSPEGNRKIGKTSIIPWGDNSRYHHALLGWYGLIEYLKQNHLLSQEGIGLANFSSETIVAHGLENSKRNALTPQFGMTEIDSQGIREILNGRGNLIFTISDGEIKNWSSVRDEFISGAKKNHYFHLQIGPRNETTRDLEANGLNVIQVMDAKDLSGKVIELTDSVYRGEIK